GSHVVFAGGRFSPQTAGGRELLAHELTHVVQQGDAAPGSVGIGRPHDRFERDAAGAAGRAMAGHAAGPLSATPASVVQGEVVGAGTIQRQPDPAPEPPAADPAQTTTSGPSAGAVPAEYTGVLSRVAADKVWLVGDPTHARDTLIDKLDKGEHVTLTDPGLG